eukprot:8779481-Ditylum_brightwellii.AAC.1
MLYMLTQHSLWNRKHHPFCYAPVIKEMVSVTVIISMYSLLQQNRIRSTEGQSAGGLTRALKT